MQAVVIKTRGTSDEKGYGRPVSVVESLYQVSPSGEFVDLIQDDDTLIRWELTPQKGFPSGKVVPGEVCGVSFTGSFRYRMRVSIDMSDFNPTLNYS